jgi:uncharacterized protein (DUF2141 family)
MKTLFALASALACFATSAAELTLDVDGLDTQRLVGAQLMVAVYTDAGSWLGPPAVGRRFAVPAPAAGGQAGASMRVQLTDLPDGPLAISLFQDTNGNGKLDSNAMGMPTEPYGFSNNAAGNFGPPSFAQAQFTPVAGQALRITLN